MTRFIALVLAALFVTTGAAGAQAAKPLTVVHVGVIPSEVAAEMFYGVDLGFFKKSGLDVRLTFFNNGGAIGRPWPRATSTSASPI
jgi:ABC-type nitrate/sulfonate/bicarbonate transport system substrate-binding protein